MPMPCFCCCFRCLAGSLPPGGSFHKQETRCVGRYLGILCRVWSVSIEERVGGKEKTGHDFLRRKSLTTWETDPRWPITKQLLP